MRVRQNVWLAGRGLLRRHWLVRAQSQACCLPPRARHQDAGSRRCSGVYQWGEACRRQAG